MWFQILSELFVNFASGWFAVVFIEPQITPVRNVQDFGALIVRFGFGILSLLAAKYLRERSRV